MLASLHVDTILPSIQGAVLEFEATAKYEQLLKKVKSACKIAYRILFVMFIIVAALLGGAIIFGLIAVLFPHTVPFIETIEPLALMSFALFSLAGAAIIFLVMLIPKDALKDESPFTLKQAKRIRSVAFLLLAKEVVGMIFPMQVIPLVANEHLSFSFEIAKSPTFIININIEMLFMAALLFCLSLVYQYGVLLQNDTRGIL